LVAILQQLLLLLLKPRQMQRVQRGWMLEVVVLQMLLLLPQLANAGRSGSEPGRVTQAPATAAENTLIAVAVI